MNTPTARPGPARAADAAGAAGAVGATGAVKPADLGTGAHSAAVSSTSDGAVRNAPSAAISNTPNAAPNAALTAAPSDASLNTPELSDPPETLGVGPEIPLGAGESGSIRIATVLTAIGLAALTALAAVTAIAATSVVLAVVPE